jgi:hypothetical protein
MSLNDISLPLVILKNYDWADQIWESMTHEIMDNCDNNRYRDIVSFYEEWQEFLEDGVDPFQEMFAISPSELCELYMNAPR